MSGPGGWPQISVITPSYGQAAYLEATIRSVLDQGYPNLQYIVIDGGSSDGSVQIIRRHESRLAYWVSEPDRGQADAINKGFAQATGAIMGWLNSDDILLPGALKRIAQAFRKPETMAVCGHRKLLDPTSRITRTWPVELPVDFLLRRVNVIAQETAYWRREVYEQIGPLDTTFRFAMDYEYWLRMLAHGYRFRLINRYLGGFRVHPESKTSNLRAVRDAELAILYRRYLGREVTHDQMRAEVVALRDPRLPLLKQATAAKLRQPITLLGAKLLRLPVIGGLLDRL